LYWVCLPKLLLSHPKQGRKRKVVASTSSGASKANKVKVLTCRPKPIGTTDVPKLIERAKIAPVATETASAMPIGAIANPAKVPELEKVAEQPKMLVATCNIPKFNPKVRNPKSPNPP
jgi:hypothetical protein